jgi:undecaprenyl-diphosphatase
MQELINALILGIIEGITEFLPISSTGHLLILQHWLGPKSDLFNIAIQAGAILAITLVYRARLLAMATGLQQPEQRDYLLKIAAAFAVTALVGLPVRWLGWELPDTVTPVAWALIIGGIAMLAVERISERGPALATVTWKVAMAVGLAQVLAGVFPGTSRSAAAIFIAMLFGLNRKPAAAEFAFLVGIPTMFAASAYALLEAFHNGSATTENWPALAVAFVAATITGFITVRWLLAFISSHRFTGFAIYRIVLGIGLLALLPANT